MLLLFGVILVLGGVGSLGLVFLEGFRCMVFGLSIIFGGWYGGG